MRNGVREDRPRPRRRLFWRVYLYGIFLLVVVAVAAWLTAWLFGSRMPLHRNTARLARLVAMDVERSDKDPGRLRRRVRELKYVLQAEVAVYRADGTLLAASQGAAPRPLEPALARSLRGQRTLHHRDHGPAIAISLDPSRPGGPYLMLQHRGTRQHLLRLVAFLCLILLLVALAAIPLAHTITRPLDRITHTARALGRGELSARTGLQRRDELGTLARVLDQMADRLDRGVRAEKELWANISHELRTPLARVRVALELCDEEQDAAAIKAHLAGISGDVTELDQLVGDVLMSTRLDLAEGAEEAAFTLRRQPLDPAAVVREAAARFAERHPGRELSVHVSDDLPQLDADPALLGRVLANLLDNAVKYSPADTPVELAAAAAEPAELVLEVRDRGAGLAEADLPRLFDHFFRAERSRARGTGGTGLGLTLCKRIVEAHGGSISAANRGGPAPDVGGVVFRCTIPLHSS